MSTEDSSTLQKIIFWAYARGTMQYDVLCALILLFIFLTPRSFFRDWPVFNSPSQFTYGDQIVDTFDQDGKPVMNVSTQLVPENLDAAMVRTTARIQLQKTLNRSISIADIKPIFGENGETVGYSIWLGQENPASF
ncbi:MAG: hypothetical protein U0V70_19860 [Terriglobia bacterium]